MLRFKKNLRFFTEAGDDQGGSGANTGSGEPQNPPADDQSQNGVDEWSDKYENLSLEEAKAKLKQREAELKSKEGKWKADQEKLKAYEEADKKAEEKKLKEKGQYEELLAQKDTELASFKEKAEKYDSLMKEKEESDLKKLEEIKKKTPKEILDKNQNILSKLSTDDQIAFLDTIVSQIPDFNNEPWKWGQDITPNSEYEKAVKDGNVKNAIKFAPEIKKK